MPRRRGLRSFCWGEISKVIPVWRDALRASIVGRKARRITRGGNLQSQLSDYPNGRAERIPPCWYGKLSNSEKKSEPAGIRTRDPLIKSQMLYRLSYRPKDKLGQGIDLA